MTKCVIRSWITFEHHFNMVTEDSKYIECIEDEAKTYTAPTMKHFVGLVKTGSYKRHLKKLIGKLGEQ